MQDQAYTWRTYRAAKRQNTSVYAAILMSLSVHILVALLAIHMFWEGANNFYAQQSTLPDEYILEVVESVYAPNARVAEHTMLDKGRLQEDEHSDTTETSNDNSQANKQDELAQIRYSQMISSQVHKMLARQPWRNRTHNATIEIMLEITDTGAIQAAKILHIHNLGARELDSIYQGVLGLTLPPPLDGKAGKYLVPVIFE
ncbi:MAG: hypothetical protein JSS50_02470 [Proteobacteria bacterium]|nr:hypothetical protein [Pseudomonadota bacterium]